MSARAAHDVRLHRSPELGLIAMELNSAHAFPRHSHDEYGIGVIRAGAQTSLSGIGRVESIAGDVIAVNPGEVHDGQPIGDGGRRWRIIYCEPQQFARHLLPDETRRDEFITPSLRDARAGLLINTLFERLATGCDRLGIEELMMAVTPRLLGQPAPRVAACSPGVARMRARIADAPARKVSLAELAGIGDMSRFAAVRAFARETGMTPYAYLIECRTRLARRLLLQGVGLADAAVTAGFSDQSHMTRAFSRQFGISPGRYQSR